MTEPHYPYHPSQPLEAPSRAGLSKRRITTLAVSAGLIPLLVLSVLYTVVTLYGRGWGSNEVTQNPDPVPTPQVTQISGVSGKYFSQMYYLQEVYGEKRTLAPSLALKPTENSLNDPQGSFQALQKAAREPGIDFLQIYAESGPTLVISTNSVRNSMSVKTWEALLGNLSQADYAGYMMEIDENQRAKIRLTGDYYMTQSEEQAEKSIENAAELAKNSDLAAVFVSGYFSSKNAKQQHVSVDLSQVYAPDAAQFSTVIEEIRDSSVGQDVYSISIEEVGSATAISIGLYDAHGQKQYTDEDFINLENRIQAKASHRIKILRAFTPSTQENTAPIDIYTAGVGHE